MIPNESKETLEAWDRIDELRIENSRLETKLAEAKADCVKINTQRNRECGALKTQINQLVKLGNDMALWVEDDSTNPRKTFVKNDWDKYIATMKTKPESDKS